MTTPTFLGTTTNEIQRCQIFQPMLTLMTARFPGLVYSVFQALIMAADGDFLARYRAVSNKLKK